ncbi:MAG: DUF1517 domain-containing protein [Geminocystis sp.]|nr:DUF1517 domain-containing protein [Geminocystis sp.]MCS7148948.1 DUF1517 domain-containing protein [Geminocystis sp.]MCX8077538.1 DUF1517 domain-containing protein [Geminocystis sp.]MDW8117205.1 DUF1517 domain-containing protein [Geminocystis sp.]HIK37743.1 DUF1517 domain-containing protein [Geminocystis sp. M7585_C2015_104]
MGLGERINRLLGKTRYVVSRIMVHLQGQEAAPLLGVLNQNALRAIEAEGDMEVMGECLVNVCEALLQYEPYWHSAANEGDVFWEESQAGDYVTELFTDSAQRYLANPELIEEVGENTPLSLPVTENIVVMITVGFEGEVPEIETDLAQRAALTNGLKALISLHYKQQYRAIAIHYSPARLGEVLTSEQVLLNFPELIPL